MFEANSAEKIVSLLENYIKDSVPFINVGKEAQQWWRKNLAHNAIDQLEEFIKSKRGN
jgi:hypothetical protein